MGEYMGTGECQCDPCTCCQCEDCNCDPCTCCQCGAEGKKGGDCGCGSKTIEEKKGGCCGSKKTEEKKGGCCGTKPKTEEKKGGCCGDKKTTETKKQKMVTSNCTCCSCDPCNCDPCECCNCCQCEDCTCDPCTCCSCSANNKKSGDCGCGSKKTEEKKGGCCGTKKDSKPKMMKTAACQCDPCTCCQCEDCHCDPCTCCNCESKAKTTKAKKGGCCGDKPAKKMVTPKCKCCSCDPCTCDPCQCCDCDPCNCQTKTQPKKVEKKPIQLDEDTHITIQKGDLIIEIKTTKVGAQKTGGCKCGSK